MERYKYILFDLDGTLTDPKVGITKSVQYALSKYDIKVERLEDLETFIGPPLKESFKEYYSFTEDKARQAIEYYREYFSERGIYENEVYTDIPLLLDELKKQSKILVVATSKPTIFAEKILKHFNLAHYFDLIVGSNLDGTRTAKAEVIQYILSELGIKDLNKVVMIGDRKHDVIGGKECNIDTIAVAYGYGSKEELREAEPTYIIDSEKDILDIIA
jgi:phosphoglycolate phosphatase